MKNNCDNTVYCVISHTHWDREWYQPFEKFRLKLCDLINNLFKIIEKYPNYIFHLDAQTIVLEDYVEIYPENEEKLKGYIKSGNIIVGPWYVQNDFYLSSGEATVRNLMIGIKLADKFGKCAMVAYTPDQFGLCSQLPQIFKQFDIKYHLFGRGYAFFDKVGDTFVPKNTSINLNWQSPDGSSVCSTMMPFWYNNIQRVPEKLNKALWKLNNLKERFKKRTDSPYLLLMNGVDHLEAQDDLLPIIDELNRNLEGGERIVQCAMEEALRLNEPYINKTVCGELREGREVNILSGVFSCRTDIKKINFEIQNMLEHKVEPLYAMLNIFGADFYPRGEIGYMWKRLIPNHAHDSICCCSNNSVMKHMKDRYLSISEIGEELIERGAKFLNHHIERDAESGTYYLTLINTNQTPYTGVVECELNVNLDEARGGIEILDHEGKVVDFVIQNKEISVLSTFSPLNLPGTVDVVNYKIQLFAESVPPFGYTNYTVRVTDSERENSGACPVLENEYIKVDFDCNRVNVLDKNTGKYYTDLLKFEDVGDNGNVYYFVPMENDPPIGAALEEITPLYQNSLKSAVSLKYTLTLPSGKAENTRSHDTVANKIEAVLSLGRGDKALSVDLTLENNAKYHLTRALINTDVDDTIFYSSSVYDVIERDSRDVNMTVRTCYTQPTNGFVYKKAKNHGLAVYTKGIYEYDNEENKIIKLSLLRSVDMIAGGVSDPKAWGVSDDLMLTSFNLSFAIMPFDGNDSAIPSLEQRINYQPVYYFDSTDTRMYAGGRPTVQDGDVGELYFPRDDYASLKLPHVGSAISVKEEVCVSALKRAENSQNVVLRLYNPAKTDISNPISANGLTVSRTNLSESISLPYDERIGKKKIDTLVLHLK